MLEKQDFQTIAEIFNSSIEPIKEEVREIRLTLENEKEMLLIRVNHLESEVRRIKNRVEAMA
nr:hypothetical protein [uncultured Blautia sp.]